ncbi:hypothetical protein DEA98_09950 [Brucella pseudogrignonensis]|nr:hypothetical protein [Brucella pseudogrignonensis]
MPKALRDALEKEIRIPKPFAACEVRSDSFNEEDRTVEVCWTTGAKVKRYSWDEGYYMEELAVDKKAIRMDRFNAMSLLDTHEQWSMDSRLGTVIPGSVKIENGRGYATIKFSRNEKAETILRDLKDGHPCPFRSDTRSTATKRPKVRTGSCLSSGPSIGNRWSFPSSLCRRMPKPSLDPSRLARTSKKFWFARKIMTRPRPHLLWRQHQ